MPACVEAWVDGEPIGQRFAFDATGNVIERTAITDGSPGDHMTWTADSIHVTGFAGERTGHLGAHGELLAWDAPDVHVKLIWNGTFTPAPPRPFFEAHYIGSAPAALLPRHTAERTLLSVMRPVLFTGTVDVSSDRPDDVLFGNARATYEQGRLTTLAIADRSIAVTWSPTGGLVHEITRSPRGSYRVDYDVDARGLVQRARSEGRDVRYEHDRSGRLVAVDATVGVAPDVLRYHSTLRRCATRLP
jgi:hypothetical protein